MSGRQQNEEIERLIEEASASLDDEDELDEGEWELDPNDPTHPDHDLSIDAGYADWEPSSKPWFVRRGVVLVITLLIVAALTVPLLLRLSY